MTTQQSGPRIGDPIPRVDGPAKVRGAVPYAADHAVDPTPLVGWIVEATIGRGRITRLDASHAEAVPGVRLVLTHDNAPPQRPFGEPEDAGRFAMSHAQLHGDRVHHHGQAIALVVAESIEAARDAALLVEADYEEDDDRRHEVTGEEHDDLLVEPDTLDGGQEPDVCMGTDFEAEFGDSEVRIDAVYTTSGLISAAMEPHATTAQWDGEQLTVHTSLQILATGVQALANTLRLDAERVRIHAPYVGGGFGSKLGIHADAVLASLAAIALHHPVKVVQTRRNVFSNAPHRGNSRQRLRLGADRNGRIRAVGHESIMPMSRGYEFAEPCASGARASYRCASLRTIHRVVKVSMPPIDSMRAPGEAIGTLALEGAMDELAVALDMDPLDLRLANLAERDPVSGNPFAHHDLGRCLEAGAERFGWRERSKPRRADGRQARGFGLAACTRPNLLVDADARIQLDGDGRFVVELDMTDIGTGTYTILSQIVADHFDVDLEAIEVRLGDSAHPQTSGSGGSFGAASSGSAVLDACQNLARKLVRIATGSDPAPLADAVGRDATFRGGKLHMGGDAVPYAAIAERAGEPIEAKGGFHPDRPKTAQYSWGAHFVELDVDRATGEIRLRRALGAFSFGRVLNRRTARSQLLGGMTYGIGGALSEALELDARTGAFVNRDFAGYHLPVQRDVPDLDVIMLDEPVEEASKLRAKGIGELGLCGIGGAIANAVFDAVGVRLRDFPLTPDRVLAQL